MHPGTAAKASSFLFLLSACASGPTADDSPVQVEALVGWIERVHVEADRSRLAIAEAFAQLNQLAAGRFGKESAATTYARFVQATDVAEQQAKRFREAVAPMLTSAQPVFENWRKALATIGSDRLRQRSELRYAVTKERYEAITAVAVPAQQRLDEFVRALRDHAAFLAHDLNAGALDDIQDEVKLVASTARTLDNELETTLQAARAYVEHAALPATPTR